MDWVASNIGLVSFVVAALAAIIFVASGLVSERKTELGRVDNDVTRAGESLRPFVEAMKDVDKRGRELYEMARRPELPRRGTRCPWCYWALYDGSRCQNSGCDFYNDDMGDSAVHLSNQEAHILIQAKPHRK